MILVLAVQVKNTKNAAAPTSNFKEVYAAGSAAADWRSICLEKIQHCLLPCSANKTIL